MATKLTPTNKNQTYFELCALKEFDSLKDFCRDVLSVSSQKIKKIKDTSLKSPVHIQQCCKIPLAFFNHGHVNPLYTGAPINILLENKDLIAISKPSHIHGHPLTYDDSQNCLSFLRSQNIFDPLRIDRDKHEKGMLFRLDYETSGILIFFKNEDHYVHYRNNYAKFAILKNYLCIVEGHFQNPGHFEYHFTPQGKKGHKMLATDCKNQANPKGQKGMMDIQFLEFNSENNSTLLSIKLKTGLRHQIRSQLQALGHPIIGDPLYEGRPFERLLLHHRKIILQKNGSEQIEFTDDSFEKKYLPLFHFDQGITSLT
jgi:23S rRNA pseudouridine1911/1915/1917 synthase